MIEIQREITVQEVSNHGKRVICMPDTYYHTLINGQEIGICAETYEIAYIAGLGYKYLGAHNSGCFVKLVCRMLGIKSVWSE